MNDELTKQIAADLGISELSADEQKQLIDQFGEIALKAATLAVIGKLSEEKRAEFGTLVEAGDPTALRAFLDKEVPDHMELARQAVDAEVQKFRDFQKP